jgi:carbon-monoxide dehydrogenase large subunit
MPNPVDAIDVKKPAYEDGPVLDEPHLPLVADRVRHVGEPIAIVVATSQAAARSAAELVEVEYDVLPAVTELEDAIAPGAPEIWPDATNNIAVSGASGDEAAVRAAIANAACIVSGTFRNQRIANAQMEPRSALGDYNAANDQVILISGSQGVHRIRNALAHCLKYSVDKVQVICPDVGGGFGPRTNVYPEQIAVVYAAHRIGRPVKWTSDRTEAFLSDYQGRDFLATGTLALDQDGRIQALQVDLLGAVGAQTVAYVPMNNSTRHHGLRRTGGAYAHPWRHHQHHLYCALPRRWTPGSRDGDRRFAGSGGEQARHRSTGNPPPQSAAAQAISLSHADGSHL